MISPMDYSLCNQTVTVYRKGAQGIIRQVLTNCRYFSKAALETKDTGHWKRTDFLLIVPGNREILPDDRVLPGEGPVFSRWAELYDAPMITSVKTYHWGNEVCHREGRGL